MFDKLYKKIVEEEEEDIFKASTPEEGILRKQRLAEIEVKEKLERGIKQNLVKLNPDGSYDVNASLDLSWLGLVKIPVKFNYAHTFDCSHNNLTSLEGCPKKTRLSFYCHHNRLTSLDGCPKEVGYNFSCRNNARRFSLEEVKERCDVNGGIFVF